jgi:hypothetical protein
MPTAGPDGATWECVALRLVSASVGAHGSLLTGRKGVAAAILREPLNAGKSIPPHGAAALIQIDAEYLR